jgi:hypothetical protein
MKEQERTREAIALIQSSSTNPEQFRALTDNLNTLNDLVAELDSNQSNASILLASKRMGTLDKLKKTANYMNDVIEQSFLTRFGIAGIDYQNIESVYNPLYSGLGSMRETRKFLINNGMTS